MMRKEERNEYWLQPALSAQLFLTRSMDSTEQSPQCYRNRPCCKRIRVPTICLPSFTPSNSHEQNYTTSGWKVSAVPWRNLCYTSYSYCSELLCHRNIRYFSSDNKSCSDVPTQVPFAQCSPTSSHSWKAEMQEDAEALLQQNSPVSRGGSHRCPGLATASASSA